MTKSEFKDKETALFLEGCRKAMLYLETLTTDPQALAITKQFKRKWMDLQMEFNKSKRMRAK